jgi:phosphoribosyl 1,2-cyclic phosphate phosphodiesterase
MKITFLGTGTSQGVPIINCNCLVCTSTDQRNKRLRTSVSVQTENISFIIDTTPDLRQQLLKYPLTRLDAVLYTHAHADHIYGLDDLRRFNQIQNKRIPVYGEPETINRLKNIFGYAFGNGELKLGLPNLEANEVNGTFSLGGIKIIPLKLKHGSQMITGFRIGKFAYCTDVSEIPSDSYDLLTDLDVLVLGALRDRPHPTHFSVNEAVEEAHRIGAKETYLIHMSHKIEHEASSHGLPPGINFSYDGLTLDL